ncbi:uncharacterized protein BO80DRAFT_101485 [Aspergillus ibericus CBS 121593]|uniref:Uncharacterized protein n=1 Tax=Aspergillus ibericus CBS 121593 TaxID=1448316 RepID=A0A395GYU9_9EURO|nr:hypothetical protein BO80DRAFT_101485 [Aspergillus ibericus CBS 121593]RAL00540.1 hypothetical protein BO80DRAFT_101485 [Aspergillus ibericus CBS 121593]
MAPLADDNHNNLSRGKMNIFSFLSIFAVKEIFFSLSVCSFAFSFSFFRSGMMSGTAKVLIGLKYSNGDTSDPRHGRAGRSGEDPTAGGEVQVTTQIAQGKVMRQGNSPKERKREVRGKDGRPR